MAKRIQICLIVVTALVVYVIVGLLLGATAGCPIGSPASPSPFACAEEWTFRYQTLLCGAAAFFVAMFAAEFAERQVEIAKGQLSIMVEQQKQAIAVATLRVDEALRQLEVQRHWVLSRSLGLWENWTINRPEEFSLPSTLSDLDAAAAAAFPERVSDLSNLFHAAAELSDVYADFLRDPWQIEIVLQASDLTEQQRQIQRDRGAAAVLSVARFMEAWAKAQDLLPAARAA